MRVMLVETVQGTSCRPRHKVYVGRSLAPLVVKLGTECRRVATVTPQPLYPHGKTLVPTDRSVGGPQTRYACFGEEKTLCFPGAKPLQSSLVAIQTAVSRLA